MNAVYSHLLMLKTEKSTEAAIQTLLLTLVALEDGLKKTNDKWIEPLFKQAVVQYGSANGWVTYSKYTFSKQLGINPAQVKKQINELKKTGLILIQDLPGQCFIEVLPINNLFTEKER